MVVSVLFYASSIKVLFVCVRATVEGPSIWSQICVGWVLVLDGVDVWVKFVGFRFKSG
jgi:hypothetical protein